MKNHCSCLLSEVIEVLTWGIFGKKALWYFNLRKRKKGSITENRKNSISVFGEAASKTKESLSLQLSKARISYKLEVTNNGYKMNITVDQDSLEAMLEKCCGIKSQNTLKELIQEAELVEQELLKRSCGRQRKLSAFSDI